MKIENIADRASGYGIPGVVVDGNDVLNVYSAACSAVERARKGEGPSLLECKTYRRRGHSRVDPAKYRAKQEVEEWLAKDPINRLKERILQDHILTREDIEKIEKQASEEVQGAVKFAVESPYPCLEDALEDVYG